MYDINKRGTTADLPQCSVDIYAAGRSLLTLHIMYIAIKQYNNNINRIMVVLDKDVLQILSSVVLSIAVIENNIPINKNKVIVKHNLHQHLKDLNNPTILLLNPIPKLPYKHLN